MKVLLVEDLLVVRDRIASMLRECDDIDEIFEASDAETALLILARDVPEVMVLDIHLPGASGLDLLRRLRADTHRPSRVVALSNAASTQYRRESLSLGADVFLDKSTDAEHIKNAILGLVSCPAPAEAERQFSGSGATSAETGFSSIGSRPTDERRRRCD